MKKLLFTLVLLLTLDCYEIYAQCQVEAGIDKTINCGGKAQLEANVIYSDFIQLNSGTQFWLNSVYFRDTLIGWAVGDSGKAMKTTDGGNTWKKLNVGTSNQLYSVYFINADTGYVAGNIGDIFRTTNGGTTWLKLNSSTTFGLYSIYFTDKNTGFAAGDNVVNGIILKTTDGGNTWDKANTGTINPMHSIYFTDENTAYVSGLSEILKTTDAGKTWKIDNQSIHENMNSIYFTDANTGYTVTRYNIWKTTNGGNNWNKMKSYDYGNSPYDLRSVFFTDANTGYIAGIDTMSMNYNGEVILKTTDAGETLNRLNLNETFGLKSIYFVNSKTGFAVGGNGTVLKYNPLTFQYQWSPTDGLSSTNISNPIARPLENTTYTVKVTANNGCSGMDSVKVSIAKIDAPAICVVGIDSTINKNRIVWEKPINMPVDSFRIYKETNVTNVYSKIGEVAFNHLSVFVDTSSTPQIKSSSYKLSIIDSCGLESDLSDLHKTMHLNINQGQGNTWNLIWSDYVGFTVSSYNIYRGTTPNNINLINTTTAGNTSYSDFNAPTSGYVYYQIEVVNPNPCSPTKKINYNSSRSNIATNNPTFSVNEYTNKLGSINIYPNPVKDIITIDFKGYTGKDKNMIELYNVTGGLIKNQAVKNKLTQLNISELEKGVYILKVSNENSMSFRKMIKE